MIEYLYTCEGITPQQIQGFFEGWPDPPSPETHLRLLANSDEVVLAVDVKTGNVVGFITAISDNVLAAYIPLLEVLPDYRGQGIGRELVDRILDRLKACTWMICYVTQTCRRFMLPWVWSRPPA